MLTKEIPLEDTPIRYPGSYLCPGCGAAIEERIIWETVAETVGRGNVILFGGGACASGGIRQLTVPTMGLHHSGSVSGATGILAALRAQGRTDLKVICMNGDGAIGDIGFHKVSAAANRNDDILLFCNDNEAFMNTGIQRSSQTPWGAWTTTTPKGSQVGWKKDLPKIMAAHGIPYVATASLAYPNDFKQKVKKAILMNGFRYIHVHCPCPTGWRFSSSKTVEVARLAVHTGMWNVYEVDQGQFKITVKPKERLPVAEYLRTQGRFRQLDEDQIKYIQTNVDKMWEDLIYMDGKTQ